VLGAAAARSSAETKAQPFFSMVGETSGSFIALCPTPSGATERLQRIYRNSAFKFRFGLDSESLAASKSSPLVLKQPTYAMILQKDRVGPQADHVHGRSTTTSKSLDCWQGSSCGRSLRKKVCLSNSIVFCFAVFRITHVTITRAAGARHG
jgi:hypothetical protein